MSPLRTVLLELVLLGACDGGRAPDPDVPVSSYDPCAFPPLVHREPEPPSADLLDLVRACEADTAACEALCQELLYRSNLGHTRVNTCMVQHSPTEHVVEVKYCDVSAEGRRPAGLVRATGRGRDVVSVHVARAAYHEAASIHAFVRLARELRRHRAPRGLVAAMRRSAAEEVVHTRLMAGLARARGATPPAVEVAAARRRSIESIAIENAREGLVGETWSA